MIRLFRLGEDTLRMRREEGAAREVWERQRLWAEDERAHLEMARSRARLAKPRRGAGCARRSLGAQTRRPERRE